MKRVFLFLITNLAIVFVLAVALQVLGLSGCFSNTASIFGLC